MLILLPKSKINTGYRILAVNLKNYDEIGILENNNKTRFSLVLMKLHDGRSDSESISDLILGTFDSEDTCIEVFEDILQALNAGEETYKIPNVS